VQDVVGPMGLPNTGSTAIVVLGHGSLGVDGVHRISERSLQLVAEAGRLAERLEPELVVLSGWSSTGGPSEAEQMRDAWPGPEVEVLLEPTARTTAENASRTLPLLLERGITAAIVLCTPVHVVRVRLVFDLLYRRHGISVRYHVVRVRPSLGALAWELVALPLVPVQLLAARSELARRLRG
jgi:uncharacterized SAM-binding protein YcdF (DUF218 family)